MIHNRDGTILYNIIPASWSAHQTQAGLYVHLIIKKHLQTLRLITKQPTKSRNNKMPAKTHHITMCALTVCRGVGAFVASQLNGA